MKWSPDRKISQKEFSIKQGPPIQARKYMTCKWRGIEFRADDKRQKRDNSGCAMKDESGKLVFGVVQFFIATRDYSDPSLPIRNFARVDW